MAQNGVKTTDLATDAQLDEVLGNRNGSSARVPVDQFIQALLGAGPLKTEFDGLKSSITTTFQTVALMVAAPALSVGNVVQTSDGRNWKIVAAGTGTADGITYIDLATHQAELIAQAVQRRAVITKGAAYTAVVADFDKLVVSSAAFTLSFDPAATLGDGWAVTVEAKVGAITLDPDAAEQINVAPSLVIPQGKSVRVICDGTGFHAVLYTPAISQADFTAGTSTVEGTITAKKLADTIAAGGDATVYTSPEQTITPSGSITLAHGLDVVPAITQFYLICKTAQGGYAANDRLGPFGSLGNGTSTAVRGIAMISDITNIRAKIGNQANSFEVMHWGTSGFTVLTNSYWKIEFQAIAL